MTRLSYFMIIWYDYKLWFLKVIWDKTVYKQSLIVYCKKASAFFFFRNLDWSIKSPTY